MKQFIENFKIIWSNKRYHALIILGIYFLFFALVFVFFMGTDDVLDDAIEENIVLESEELKGLDLFKTVDKYKYNINGEYNVDVVVNDTITIEYLDNYYNVDNVLEELKIYDFSKYNPSYIYDIINNSLLESTNYINNTNTYVISASEFNKLYNETVVGDIKTVTYLDNENISKVEINFPDYILTMEVE